MARTEDRDRRGGPLDPALRPPPTSESGEGGFGVSVAVFPLFIAGGCLAALVGSLYPDNGLLIVTPPALAVGTVAWLFYRHSIEGRIRHRTRALTGLLRAADRRDAGVGRELLRLTPAPPIEAEPRDPLAVSAGRFLRRPLPPPAASRGFERDPDHDRWASERAALRALHEEDGVTLADGVFMVPLVNKPTGRRALLASTRRWLAGLAFIERFADREAAWLVALALTEPDPQRFGALLVAIERRAADRAWAGRFVERGLAHETPIFRWHAAAALGRLAALEAALAEAPGCDAATADTLLLVAARATTDRDALTRWSKHPTPAVRGAVAALPDVPMALVMALLGDEVPRVAARFVPLALAGEPPLERVRAVLDRADRFDGGERVEGVVRALDRMGERGEAVDLPRIVRWLELPEFEASARRARDRLRARHADAVGAGGLALSGEQAGELALADDAANGRH